MSMGAKYRVDFEMQIDVTFEDEEKAKSVFIDGTWKDSFYEYDDLFAAAGHFAHMFYETPEYWHSNIKTFGKEVEGVGTFYQHGNNNSWHLVEGHRAHAGNIEINVSYELEPTWTTRE